MSNITVYVRLGIILTICM